MNKDEFGESISSTKISYKELQESFPVSLDGEPFCGHRALWRAVITQALMDAGSNSNKVEYRKEKARAIAWLNGDTEDFLEVCSMAGLDPDYVKRKAYEAIKNGCKWRVEYSETSKDIERKVVYMEDLLTTKMLIAS